MCVGRAMRRFLEEKDGPVNHIQLDCLRPRVGSNLTLEAYPEGSSDLFMFELKDVIAGPLLSVGPKRKRAWRFPNLEEVSLYFEEIKDVDRAALIDKNIAV